MKLAGRNKTKVINYYNSCDLGEFPYQKSKMSFPIAIYREIPWDITRKMLNKFLKILCKDIASVQSLSCVQLFVTP